MDMYILENVPLSSYSTMRLGGTARYLTDITDRAEIPEAVTWAEEHNVPLIMIGSGSNIVWKDEGFPGLILVNKLERFETFNEDDENVYITIGAGENWDPVVERCVSAGYSGIEQLSLVPGTAGATPIQNVGAYGREIAEVLVTVEAFDISTKQFVNIPTIDCGFAYRTSRFKTTDRGRYLISAITLHLTKTPPQPPFYAAVEQYFGQHQVTDYTAQAVREAVIAIRTAKLPDPAKVPNNGSFFYNPVVSSDQLNTLLDANPDLPHWKLEDGSAKISAAWLVEQCGFKGTEDKETGMATWPNQPLVLVNQSATQTAQLLAFRQKITGAVQAKFGVSLQQEPELLP